MRHGLQPRAGLTASELEEVRRLADICNAAEQIEIKLNWGTLASRPEGVLNDFLYYDEGRLVGFLGIYSFISAEAEISGMVHPDYRRRGIFSELTKAAQEECSRRAIPKLIFINQRGSAGGKAYLAQFGAVYDFSEYVMEKNSGYTAQDSPAETHGIRLRLADRSDTELLVTLNMAGFAMAEQDAREYVTETINGEKERTLIAELGPDWEPIGKIGAMVEKDGSSFIYGFCVLPEKRGLGYGRSILRQTIGYLQEQGQTGVMKLEVAVGNEGALGLYKSCGFETKNVNDYFVYPAPLG